MDDLMLPEFGVMGWPLLGGEPVYGFTPEQMREYAKKAVEADRALRPTSGEYAQGYAEGFNDACKTAPLD